MSSSYKLFFILLAFGAIIQTSDCKKTPRIQRVGYNADIKSYYSRVNEDEKFSLPLLAPKGVPGGGVQITVLGENFRSLKNTEMIVFYKDQEFISHCRVDNDYTMYCESPKIWVRDEMSLDPDNPILLEYNFLQFDDYLERDRSRNETIKLIMEHNLSNFQLYPNPQFTPFDGVKQISSRPDEDYLTISGRNLDLVFSEDRIIVHTGDFKCFVVNVYREEISCLLISFVYTPRRPYGKHNVKVVVGNLFFDIGEVEFV